MTPASLKAWRKHLGLSQKAAAEAIGKSRAMYQYYEAGAERARWWAEMEAWAGSTFDKRISWAELIANVEKQPDWVFDDGAHEVLYCNTSLGGCHD
jgi:transcriptional regulator with XRE-family HTH domain